MSAADDNQVLSQAEIDAMLGNAGPGSELDDPPAPLAAAPPGTKPSAEQPQTVWSTGSPEAPLRPTAAPEEPPAHQRRDGQEEPGGRRGLFRKILGKSSAAAAEATPPTAAPRPDIAQPPADRPRPALDIDDDLAATGLEAGADAIDAAPDTDVLEPGATPSAAPLDAVADVMSVFLEDEGMDPVLRRLVERIPDVSVEDLLAELREVCALLGVDVDRSRGERAA